jgi:hypothetical protein
VNLEDQLGLSQGLLLSDFPVFPNVILLAIFLILVAYYINHNWGARRDGPYPRWMINLGEREVPRILRSGVYQWITWLSRRILPLVLGFAAWLTTAYLSGEPATIFGLTAVDWWALGGVLIAVFSAGLLFAKRRHHPMERWYSFVSGSFYLLAGIAFILSQLFFFLIPIEPGTRNLLGRMALWTSQHDIRESLGWGAGLLGVGLFQLTVAEEKPSVPEGGQQAVPVPADEVANSRREVKPARREPRKRKRRRKRKG